MNVSSSISNKEEWIYLIRLCEKARRYNDMCEYFNRYLDLGLEVSSPERHLFSIAVHGRVSEMRTAYRKCLSANRGSTPNVDSNRLVLTSIASSIIDFSQKTIESICSRIKPTCISPDQRVYFIKLHADFERYLAEVHGGRSRAGFTQSAHELYMEASDVALCHMSGIDPIRLSLMLNFSIFYYDIYNEPERACIVAKAACDDAIDAGVLSMKNSAKELGESLAIFNLIRDNLTRWTSHLTPTSA
jgi:hypothetical protein